MPSLPALPLLARRLAADLLLLHLGGAAIAALAMLVEGAPPADLLARLPPTWATLAAPLSLLGAALGAWRLRRDGTLLALATAGLDPRALLPLAALLAALLAAPAPLLLRPDPPGADDWVRSPDAWWRAGRAWPDPPPSSLSPTPLPPSTSSPASPTRPIPAPLALSASPLSLLAGAAGAAAGLYASAPATLPAACMLLLLDALGRGLALRHGDAWAWLAHPILALWLGWLLLRAPLFPRR